MNEILSLELEKNFQKYVQKVIEDFEVKKDNFNDFEPKGFELIFMIKNLSCTYCLVFERDKFYFRINYEIDDEKNPELREKFYECLDFLIVDEKFYSQTNTSIILKSKLSSECLERAKIIFFVEKSMNSYFFPETKIALEEIANEIFTEFKEIMTKIWITLYENFETVDFSNIPVLNFCDSKNFQDEENSYHLPAVIKIHYDYYKTQEMEQEVKIEIIPKRKKNWVKRIYIFMKKLN